MNKLLKMMAIDMIILAVFALSGWPCPPVNKVKILEYRHRIEETTFVFEDEYTGSSYLQLWQRMMSGKGIQCVFIHDHNRHMESANASYIVHMPAKVMSIYDIYRHIDLVFPGYTCTTDSKTHITWIYPDCMSYENILSTSVYVPITQYGLRIFSDIIDKIYNHDGVGLVNNAMWGIFIDKANTYIDLASGEYEIRDIINFACDSNYNISYCLSVLDGTMPNGISIFNDSANGTLGDNLYLLYQIGDGNIDHVTSSIVDNMIGCDYIMRQITTQYVLNNTFGMSSVVIRGDWRGNENNMDSVTKGALRIADSIMGRRMDRDYPEALLIDLYPIVYDDVYWQTLPCFAVSAAIEYSRTTSNMEPLLRMESLPLADDVWCNCMSHLVWAARYNDLLAPVAERIMKRVNVLPPSEYGNWQDGLIYILGTKYDEHSYPEVSAASAEIKAGSTE